MDKALLGVRFHVVTGGTSRVVELCHVRYHGEGFNAVVGFYSEKISHRDVIRMLETKPEVTVAKFLRSECYRSGSLTYMGSMDEAVIPSILEETEPYDLP